MADVTIYTSSTCPLCWAAKQLLSSIKTPFKEVLLDQDPELRMRLSEENDGWRTVPMIFIGEKFIGGFSELNMLHQKGELAALLQ
jgi:glutaredoxin 3